jgi:glutamate racemase
MIKNYDNEYDNRPIAFFDSGVGGITVYTKVKELMPNENFIYFGDLKNSPYGEKSKEELIIFADKIFKFFQEKDVKAVVMACNTTSAATYEALKNNYSFKIYPIIQSCTKEISQLSIEKIGVFATQATINSKAYSNELKKYNSDLEIFEMACPEWVQIVEEKLFEETESLFLVEKYMKSMLLNNPDKIILGCTHYPYLKELLLKFAPENMFIDPSEIFAKIISNSVLPCKKNNFGSEKFYVSANAKNFKKAAEMFYKLEEVPEIIIL